MGAEAIILLTLAGILLAASGLLVSRLFAPRSYNVQKGEAYECGIPAIGEAKVQFHVGYYLYALMFLIFDVEVMFLLAWAVTAKKIGMLALVEVVFFLFILFLGLLYAWKKGATKWE